MEDIIEYGRTWGGLLLESALVTFTKSNGHVRLMLCTRNLDSLQLMHPDKKLKGLLDGFDKRCNRSNGNIAVVDLLLGDCRSFNINRVLAVKWLGEIDSMEKLNSAIEEYEKIEKKMSAELGYSVMGGEFEKGTQIGPSAIII